MKGILYLVATPIGNLEDITLRAIRILKQVDMIAAEDTRHTLGLLNHLEIKKPLISYHRHNEQVKTMELMKELESGKNIALVSDAGTPIISDPGEEVVKQAIESGITVVPIPGACAFVTALIASGLNSKQFTFYGFLPINKKTRKQQLEQIQSTSNTVILYEAPHKLQTTLQDLNKVVKEREIVIARELTKLHEEFFRGTIEQAIAKYQNPKGEYVILIEGTGSLLMEEPEMMWNTRTIEEHYQYYEKLGYEKKEIIKQIAKDRKCNKNEIYQQFIN